MGMYLNIGNAGFRSVRKSLYVDKSDLISHINKTLGTKEKLTCVSRPRRFGKSYATQMLCAYYDRSCDSRELFADLKIASDEMFGRYLNQYDVIYLDMIWFISTARNIKDTVLHLQTQVIKELCTSFSLEEEEVPLPMMLSKINERIGRKFIIIIDEWDALFREAKEDMELQKEYIQLLRGLFKSSQTDKMIEAAYMTGILPIKKYGTQSALTDFREYTMLAPKKLAQYVGFTEDEVKTLCKDHGMQFEEAKRWYDGYSFPKIKSIYSPNSVIQAMQNEEFGNYWTETETYESLKVYIDMDKDGLKEAIVQMLGGARCSIDAGTFQNDMTNIKSRDDVLTLLVHLGYLAYDSAESSVFIPNEEVRQEFIRAVKGGRHTEIARMISESDRLLRDTLAMNGKRVAEAIEEVHSVFTTPLFYNNEQALRSVIRFAYISCMDEFRLIQELPSGKGCADMVYLPKKSAEMPILLIELKWNKSVESAIRQIKDRNYPQVLEGLWGDILLIGINYDEKTKKHTCVIESHEKR